MQFEQARPDAGKARLPSHILADRVRDSNRRWAQMEGYLTSTACRAAYLEGVFEDEPEGPCGLCDLCQPPLPPSEQQVRDWIGDGIGSAELQRLAGSPHRAAVREILERWRAEGKVAWRDGVIRLTAPNR